VRLLSAVGIQIDAIALYDSMHAWSKRWPEASGSDFPGLRWLGYSQCTIAISPSSMMTVSAAIRTSGSRRKLVIGALRLAVFQGYAQICRWCRW